MGVSLVAAGALTVGTGAPAPPIPAGSAAGDIMVLLCESSNSALPNQAALISAGWTEITGSPQGTGSGTTATRLTAFWKRHTGSESAPNLGDSGDHTGGIILTFRGCVASGNPIDDSAGSVAASATTAVTFPAVTTSEDACLILNAVAWSTDTASAQASGWANDVLVGLVERSDSGSTAGNGGGISTATGVLAAAGSSGSTTCTLATSSVQGRMTIALIPEPVLAGDYALPATDSGSNYAQKSTYPPITVPPPGDYAGDDDGVTTIWCSKNWSGGFTIDVAYTLHSLAAIGGGPPISAAKLRLYAKAKTDDNARYGVQAEYYDFGGASDVSDWAAEITTPCTAIKSLGDITTGTYFELPLTDLTGLTPGATVGVRLIIMPISGAAAPTGRNVVEIGSHTDTNKPQLIVTLTDPGGEGNETEVDAAVAIVTALPVDRARGRSIPAAAATITAPAVGRGRARTLDAAAVSVSAQTVSRTRGRTLDPAGATVTAEPLGRGRARTLDTAAAHVVPSPVGRARARGVDTATVIIAANPPRRARSRSLIPAAVVVAAPPLGTVHITFLAVAVARVGAPLIGRGRARTIGPAAVTVTAPLVGRGRARLLDPARATVVAPLFVVDVAPAWGAVTATATRYPATYAAATQRPASHGDARTFPATIGDATHD